ncbi:MAG: DUF3604 domain-containing protein, partial [Halieaceae bacterium]|nr:DUF3604 domain-containing protein [Halieaceae bacterium]
MNLTRCLQVLCVSVFFAVGVWIYLATTGFLGERQSAGTLEPHPRGPDARLRLEENYSPSGGDKQILFGDLHAHTTYSFDAYNISLPMYQGEGSHPPADACDFARYCAVLDFWSINDHAEGLTTAQWSQTRDMVRQCNAAAGDPDNPDMVTFLGWEWTQIGDTPAEHYGHKNIILRDTAEEDVPTRPIASREQLFPGGADPYGTMMRLILIAGARNREERQRYFDF